MSSKDKFNQLEGTTNVTVPSEYGTLQDATNLSKNGDKVDDTNIQTMADEELEGLGENYTRDSKTNEVVYTDPSTKIEYVLNPDRSGWIPKTEAAESLEAQYDFDGSTYCYTDHDGIRYKWDLDNKAWVKDVDGGKPNDEDEEESEEDDNTTDEDRRRRQYRKRKAAPGWGKAGEYITDPETGAQLYKEPGPGGMVYEWDLTKNAWFPRINEDFMAQYQMNYGFDADGQSKPTMPEEPKEEDGGATKKDKVDKEKAPPKKPQWFEEEKEKSTKVYVAGLPTQDYDEEKFALLMGKVSSVCFYRTVSTIRI